MSFPASTVEIAPYAGNRHALIPLFSLADDSAMQVSSYIGLGELLVAGDEDAILGHVQIVPTGRPEVLEIKSLAVRETRQGRGIGSALVAAAVARSREQGARRLTVSTAAADTGALRFYQRLGFRMCRIVQDAFTPSHGYPAGATVDGIALRDQVILELDLPPSKSHLS
jgi:ribosomal protein S18 acetylase RimI-like enzyme